MNSQVNRNKNAVVKIKNTKMYILFIIFSCILFNGCNPSKDYFRNCEDGTYLYTICPVGSELNTKEKEIIVIGKENEAVGTYEILSGEEANIIFDERDFQKYDPVHKNGERYIYLSDNEIMVMFLFCSMDDIVFEDNYWFLATFRTDNITMDELKETLVLGEKNTDEEGNIVYCSILNRLDLFRISEGKYEEYTVNHATLNSF